MLEESTVVLFFLHWLTFSISEVSCLPTLSAACRPTYHTATMRRYSVTRPKYQQAAQTNNQAKYFLSHARLLPRQRRLPGHPPTSGSPACPLHPACPSCHPFLFLSLSPIQQIPNKFLSVLESCTELIGNWQVLKRDSCNGKKQ